MSNADSTSDLLLRTTVLAEGYKAVASLKDDQRDLNLHKMASTLEHFRKTFNNLSPEQVHEKLEKLDLYEKIDEDPVKITTSLEEYEGLHIYDQSSEELKKEIEAYKELGTPKRLNKLVKELEDIHQSENLTRLSKL
jgi:uncharacterized membrane protein (DUF106 family)